MIFQISILKVPDYMLELIKEELQTKQQAQVLKQNENHLLTHLLTHVQGEIDMEGYVQGRILKAFSEIIIVIIEAN